MPTKSPLADIEAAKAKITAYERNTDLSPECKAEKIAEQNADISRLKAEVVRINEHIESIVKKQQES
jgi:hypothetical protein